MFRFTQWVAVRTWLEGTQQRLVFSQDVQDPPFQQMLKIVNSRIWCKISSKYALPTFSWCQPFAKERNWSPVVIRFLLQNSTYAKTRGIHRQTQLVAWNHMWLSCSLEQCCFEPGSLQYFALSSNFLVKRHMGSRLLH